MVVHLVSCRLKGMTLLLMFGYLESLQLRLKEIQELPDALG